MSALGAATDISDGFDPGRELEGATEEGEFTKFFLDTLHGVRSVRFKGASEGAARGVAASFPFLLSAVSERRMILSTSSYRSPMSPSKLRTELLTRRRLFSDAIVKN